MRLPVPMVRRGYRLAYRLLRVYWFVVRPDVNGVKCLLTRDGRVLLVRHSYGPRTWELPGGGVKSGESAAAAARREMTEELGVTIDAWTDLGELRGTMQGRHDRLHCFHAEIGSRPLSLEPGEIVVGAWFPRDHLPEDTGRYVTAIVKLAGRAPPSLPLDRPRRLARDVEHHPAHGTDLADHP